MELVVLLVVVLDQASKMEAMVAPTLVEAVAELDTQILHLVLVDQAL
jgi:hypothetical protein